jgi:hypothetical protein
MSCMSITVCSGVMGIIVCMLGAGSTIMLLWPFIESPVFIRSR